MAKGINYEKIWDQALDDACGGNQHEMLESMELGRQRHVLRQAFRQYLLACYCDHVRHALGPALAPAEDIGVLQLKAALVNNWKTTDVPSSNKEGMINALAGEVSTFKLPEDAYAVVAYLEKGIQIDAFGRQYPAKMLSEMVKHHRPDHLAD